jgi:hypothetical protein
MHPEPVILFISPLVYSNTKKRINSMKKLLYRVLLAFFVMMSLHVMAAFTANAYESVTGGVDADCSSWGKSFTVPAGMTATGFINRQTYSSWLSCGGVGHPDTISYVITGPAGIVYKYVEYWNGNKSEPLGPISALTLTAGAYRITNASGGIQTSFLVTYDLVPVVGGGPAVPPGGGTIIRPNEIDFKDVDVYQYTYRNWDNANWSAWGSLSVASGANTNRRIYIQFDVDKLKSKAGNLDKVELVLNNDSSTRPANINIYRVTERWNAGSGTYHSGETEPTALSGEITWNNQPKWDSSTIVATTSVGPADVKNPVSWDITDLVNGWVSGKYPNYGLVLVEEGEGATESKHIFPSSENTNVDKRPYILVGGTPGGNVTNPAAAKDIVLWGKQTEGSGMTNAKTDGNSITLTKTATIVRVEGNAKGYCIWSGGKSVLCGGSIRNQNIVGRSLPPGTYRVLPGLHGQKEATVTIYLQ